MRSVVEGAATDAEYGAAPFRRLRRHLPPQAGEGVPTATSVRRHSKAKQLGLLTPGLLGFCG